MHTRTVMALTKERGDKARLSDHRRRSHDVKTRECLDRHGPQEISPRVTSTKHVKTPQGATCTEPNIDTDTDRDTDTDTYPDTDTDTDTDTGTNTDNDTDTGTARTLTRTLTQH